MPLSNEQFLELANLALSKRSHPFTYASGYLINPNRSNGNHLTISDEVERIPGYGLINQDHKLFVKDTYIDPSRPLETKEITLRPISRVNFDSLMELLLPSLIANGYNLSFFGLYTFNIPGNDSDLVRLCQSGSVYIPERSRLITNINEIEAYCTEHGIEFKRKDKRK